MYGNETIANRVAARYLIGKVSQEVVLGDTGKIASVQVYKEILCSFGEFLVPVTKTAAFSVSKAKEKLKRVFSLLKSRPKVLNRLKSVLGVDSIRELPKAIREWAKRGKDAIKKLFKKASQTFPLSLYLVPSSKMPGLTDLLARITASSPMIAKALSKVSTSIVRPLDAWMEKHLPTLGKPVKAAVFAWIWFNVAEISWDMEALVKGFSGQISIGDLFSSFPESALGALFASFGLGYGLLPVSIIARILWLVGNKYLEYKSGRGFVVRWDRIKGERGTRPEIVPA
jgi:hypothetical protein